MARPAGARNPDFAAKRRALAAAIAERAIAPGGTEASMRELARAAGVSVPTLRHYFGDRQGALVAAFDELRRSGAEHVRMSASEHPDADLRASLDWFVDNLIRGLRDHGVGRLLGGALAHALGHPRLGPAFVDQLLEPTLQAAELRLARHEERGELRPCDLRHAALALVSPLLLAVLHQLELGGARCRPLDLDAFAAAHLETFLHAYAAQTNKPRRQPTKPERPAPKKRSSTPR